MQISQFIGRLTGKVVWLRQRDKRGGFRWRSISVLVLLRRQVNMAFFKPRLSAYLHSIIGVFLISSLMGCSMNMAHTDKIEFRFEDMKTSDEATRTLYKLHPAKTPVAPLLETLKGAGAKCSPVKVLMVDGEWIRGSGRRGGSQVHCDYRYLPSPYSAVSWGVSVDFDNAGMIYSIATAFYLT